MKLLFRIFLKLAGFDSLRPAQSRRSPRRGRRLRRVVAAAGALAIFLGAALVSVGLYDYLNDTEASIEAEPPALANRFDPGGVYDRPVGIVPPTPAPTAAPATETPAPTAAPVVAAAPPPLRDKPYNIVIDKIGVNAGVFAYGLDANNTPEVPYNGWDVAWYNFSAQPGTGSNAVFAAHVTWNGPAVFYRIDALTTGDLVKLIAEDGTVLTYRVTESYLVDPDDPASLAVMHGTDHDVITLITCGGTPFYVGGTAGYDYTNRQIVRAELVEVIEA